MTYDIKETYQSCALWIKDSVTIDQKVFKYW